MAGWSLHFAFLDMLLYINYLISLSQIIQYSQWIILLSVQNVSHIYSLDSGHFRIISKIIDLSIYICAKCKNYNR